MTSVVSSGVGQISHRFANKHILVPFLLELNHELSIPLLDFKVGRPHLIVLI